MRLTADRTHGVFEARTNKHYRPKPGVSFMWVVVKIVVPFWVAGPL